MLDGLLAVVLYCGVEQLVARRAHNPEGAGSSPASATIRKELAFAGAFLYEIESSAHKGFSL